MYAFHNKKTIISNIQYLTHHLVLMLYHLMMQCLQRLLKEMGTVSAQTSVKRMKTSHQPSGNSMLVKAESQNIRNHNPKSKKTLHTYCIYSIIL